LNALPLHLGLLQLFYMNIDEIVGNVLALRHIHG